MMFPLNLQRNIVQLDKQISLLESECKNMEIEKKKKTLKPDLGPCSCSKNSDPRLKTPTATVAAKKSEIVKRSKKLTPPVSSRVLSGGSLTSHRRACSENSEAITERKIKVDGKPSGRGHTSVSPQNGARQEKCSNCTRRSASRVDDAGSVDVKKRDHVLVIPNAGGAIEVTVTQKTDKDKENLFNYPKSQGRSLNEEKELEEDENFCKCQKSGPKWSEILSSAKRNQPNSGSHVRISLSPNVYDAKRSGRCFSVDNVSNGDSVIHEGTFEMPIKLPSQLCNIKQQAEINSRKLEKEVQCSLYNPFTGGHAKESNDPVKMLQILATHFQQMSNGDFKKLTLNSDISTKTKENFDQYQTNSAPKLPYGANNSHLDEMKQQWETLIKEKSLLTEELAARDEIITKMKQREDGYLSLVSTLRLNLEKAQANAQEGLEAVKQVNIIKSKLIEQMKVSEAMRKNLSKLQEALETSSLENDKLKTQVKIFKLEAQKHEILLAGKEAEIKKYREEIENFHQQIREHLSSLKSNAQGMDVEKIMEAIMQQSQIFAQTEFDSVLEKDGDDSSSKGQNVLIHSSPTSTKTSIVNSSWKQISSIYDHDQSKANSDVIFLNEDGNEKNFFEAFGGNPLPESPVVDKKDQPENLQMKKPEGSFGSCLSAREEESSSLSSEDSVISKETADSRNEEGLKRESGISVGKAQSNIDELLRNMKMKFSKEIFNNSIPSCTSGDFMDVSQVSSISPV